MNHATKPAISKVLPPVWLLPWCLYLFLMPSESILDGFGLQLPLLALGVFSGLALALAPTRRAPPANSRQIAVVVLVLAIFGTSLLSVSPADSFRGLVRVSFYWLTYVLAASACLKGGQFDAVLRSWLSGGATVAALTVYAGLTGILGSDKRVTLLVAGVEADPNFLCAGLVGPFAAGLYLLGHKGLRVPGALLSGLIGWAVIMTGSRGGALALVVVLLAFLAHRGHYKTLIAATSTFVLGFLALGPALGRFNLLSDMTGSRRTEIWSAILGALDGHWLTGSGLNSSPAITGSAPGLYWAREAHSTYVQALGETGALGAVALLIVLGTHLAIRRGRKTSAPLFAAMAGIIVAAAFLHLLTMQLFWACLIVAAQAAARANAPYPDAAPTPRNLESSRPFSTQHGGISV